MGIPLGNAISKTKPVAYEASLPVFKTLQATINIETKKPTGTPDHRSRGSS